MNEIFNILVQSRRASQIAMDAVGRTPYPSLGVVVNNQDPENRRRVKVALPSNPTLESDWLMRLSPYPFVDAPLPQIGQTVLILYADGIETNGWYLSVMNDTNPSRDKQDAIKDLSEEIPGNKDVSIKGDKTEAVEGSVETSIEGNEDHRTEGDIVVECGKALTLKTDSGASITLSSTGFVEIKDALNRRIRLGGPGGVTNQWDLAGFPLTVINASSFTINGQEVATLGAMDNDGDTLISKGW